ncbi:MAG: NAD(P)/FAD-dependent oxidoreductase [Bdellovibrionales bacterium]|nr:NAD(P)/FAD-dependent oxidoreductase [Bdellovibrionales bacterium]
MKTKVVIIGAGTAGLSVLKNLHRRRKDLQLTIIEPQETHYYQPLWTLVSGGIFPFSKSSQPMSKYIPKSVDWIKEYVSGFDPENNKVLLKNGEEIAYDYLVVAPGIQIDWDKIEGLKQTLGKNGVSSNYSKDHVPYSWQTMNSFKGGKALFTFPSTPIKCAGAPQKVMYLAEETFRRNNIRPESEVKFVSAGGAIFGVQKYREALEKLLVEKDIHTLFSHDLVKIDGEKKIATFKNTTTGALHEETFDMIHVTPPMSAPDFIKNSKLANEAGWVDVNKHSTQHMKYKNIFSIGDASGLPNSKTGAAIRRQGPVMISQLLAEIDGTTSDLKYNGYASCPLVTSRSSCILAEFDYDGNPDETFVFDQAKPRLSMFLLKKYIIPFMYWNAMMRGYF